MSFELSAVTKILVTNANPRRELHGEEKVRAIDISFSLSGENTLLDLIEPGLREHHYCNRALKAGQETLPDVVVPLPNLRHPKLPTAYDYAKGEKYRGYRFVWDYGIEDSHVDFTDVVLSKLHYEIAEGGSVTIMGTIQYNGEELQDNDLYGELAGLASEGDIHIQLLAPAELIAVKKGYRAGQPDTPATTKGEDDGQGELTGTEGDEEQAKGVWPFPPGSPEDAFAGTQDPAA